jgi:hypothetical protein
LGVTLSADRARVLLARLPRNPAFWYALALTAAAVVEDRLSTGRLWRLMDWCSTNLANIRPSGHPVEAFVASAFIPQESAGVWPFFALSLFSVVAVLGARRTVVLLGGVHIGVSMVTEGLVWWRIHHGTLPWSDERMWDTGPSYLVVTALTVAIAFARPVWLRVVWAACLIGAAPSLLQGIDHGDYTAIGHILSFSVGLVVVLRMRHSLSGVNAGAEAEVAPEPLVVPATPQ